MSQRRAEIVRAHSEAWNAGERKLTQLAKYLDPAIELESPLSSVAGEPYRGYAGIERWVSDLDEQFAEWHTGIDDLREVGDQVIAIGPISARGRTSGIPLQFDSALVCRCAADNRVSWIRIYADVEEARQFVGLSA